MTVLEDYQFELAGVPFGKPHPIRVRSWDTGTAAVRSQSRPNPSADAYMFGRDQKNPAMWRFRMHTRTSGPAQALAALAQIEETWDAEESRLRVGEATELRYRVGGRTRVAYGKPQEFRSEPSTLLRSGHIPIEADFLRADTLHYDEAWEGVELTLAASRVGGVKTPFRFPLHTIHGGEPRLDVAYVGGTAATWAVVEFSGAAIDPWVEIAGWRCEYLGTPGSGGPITVDPRPWEQKVTRSDGAHVTGLSPRTRLNAMRLPPGNHTARFGCASALGSVTATIRWQPASKSI